MRWGGPVLAACVAVLCGCRVVPLADRIISGGRIHTGNAAQPVAEAIAVRNGTILAIGTESDIRRHAGSRTRRLDLRGGVAFPGFTDSHMHLEGLAERTLHLDLVGSKSLDEVLGRVAARVRDSAPGSWIVGRGWIETFWSPPAFPTRYDLDRVAPDHPVALWRIDGHGLLVNSRALALAAIDGATPDPPGGEIVRGPDGEPAGMLLDNAQNAVVRLVPPPSREELRRGLVLAAAEYARRGWTAIQIAGSSAEDLREIEALVRSREIPLRVYAALLYEGRDTPGLDALLGGRVEVDRRFTLRAIKVSYDGALGSRGAALLAPYDDAPGAGFLKYEDGEILDLASRALASGVQLEVHAIGDRANRRILDLYEEAFARVPAAARALAEPRFRVEHAQILALEEIPRFARLGVIPSMQPSHAISDLHFAPRRLGTARLAGAYAWRSLLDAGAIVPAGSDAPVEKGDPLIELYAAIARRDLEGFAGDGWHLEERVTRDEALRMLTIWPAYAAFEEEWRGTLEPGKVCDLTVLSEDVLSVAEARIPEARCLMTIVDGEVVHAR